MKFIAFTLIFLLSTTPVLARGITDKTDKGNKKDEKTQIEQDVIDFKDLTVLEAPVLGPKSLDAKNIKIKYEEEKQSKVFSIVPKLFRVASGIPADAVELGLEWILNSQSGTGFWTKDGKNRARDVEAVISTLHWLEYTETVNWGLAVDWMVMDDGENTDSLSRTISALALAENTFATELATELVTQVNPTTGGFGYSKYYREDILTTALALKALTESAYVGEDGLDETAHKTLYELLVMQNPDGGYGYTQDGDSKLYPTEIVLDAMLPYDNLTFTATGSSGPVTINIGSTIDAGFEYIKYQQNEDGSFGDNVAQTALAYDLLLRKNDYPNNNSGAIEYLLNAQSEDGSYNESDPYATALAVKALAKPDLKIGDVSISTVVPSTLATITIPIINEGYLDAKPFTLEIYLAGALFNSVNVPYTMATNSTLNMQVEFSSGFPVGTYDFEFKVIPSQTVGELNADNNTKDFSVSFSSYAGPTPPEWFGAATSATAGKIVTSWLTSEDPDLSYYKVYIGTTPGTYTYSSSARSASSIGVTFSGFTVDATYYFSIVAFDASGVRGDYSIESSAVAKTTPAYTAGIHGGVTSDSVPVPNATLTIHAFGDTITTDSNGEFDFNIYPGSYYFKASKTGFYESGQGVTLPTGVDTELNFDLAEIDDGVAPGDITGMSGTEGDGTISIAWAESTDTSFKKYNIYRSAFPITSTTSLTPITSILDKTVTAYTDDTIRNGIEFYYAVVVEDKFGNQSASIASVGPLAGNSAPAVDDLSVMQEGGYVIIDCDLIDNEDESLNLSLEYFDGASWVTPSTVSGIGVQNTGLGKTIYWNVKNDFPNKDIDTAMIRLTIDDGHNVNNITSQESGVFSIDTLGPVITINNLETNDDTPTITGTSDEALDELSLLINGNQYTATIDGLTWSVETTNTLANGFYEVVATGTDLFDNTSSDQSTYEVLIGGSMNTERIYAEASDGSILKWNTLWEKTHDAMFGRSVMTTGTTFIVRTGKNRADKFLVERGFLTFNTESLPDYMEIISANLVLYIESTTNRDNDGDDFITLVNTSQEDTSDLVIEDFDQVGELTTPIEITDNRKDITDIAKGAHLTFELNPTGISNIITDSFTKIGLREGHDILNSPFNGLPNQYNSLQIRSSEYEGTDYDPVLEVNYSVEITNYYDANGEIDPAF